MITAMVLVYRMYIRYEIIVSLLMSDLPLRGKPSSQAHATHFPSALAAVEVRLSTPVALPCLSQPMCVLSSTFPSPTVSSRVIVRSGRGLDRTKTSSPHDRKLLSRPGPITPAT